MKQEWKEIELGNKMFFEIIGSGINRFEDSKEYLSTECIKETEIKKTEGEITFNERPSRANMQPKLNSVWFAKMQNTLKVYSFNKNNSFLIDKYILSTGFAGIKVLENIDEDYIRIFFLSPIFNKIKDSNCSGATQKSINNNAISKIKIPLPFSNGKPDLQKQKQIVAILENLERLKEKRKRTILLLDKYLKSVFNEMFVGKGFGEVELNNKDVVELITDGFHNSMEKNPPEIFLIKIENIKEGKVIFENADRISRKAHEKESKRCKPQVGDVLLTCVGTIGKTAIVLEDYPEFNIVRSVALIRPNKNSLDAVYLKYSLETLKSISQMNALQNSTTRKGLYLKSINKIKIPLPPIELQEEFASIVEKVEKLKEKQKQSLEKIEELFNSSLSKAFVGELI